MKYTLILSLLCWHGGGGHYAERAWGEHCNAMHNMCAHTPSYTLVEHYFFLRLRLSLFVYMRVDALCMIFSRCSNWYV